MIAWEASEAALNDHGEIPLVAIDPIPPNTRRVGHEKWREYCYKSGISSSRDKDAQRKAFGRASAELMTKLKKTDM